MKKAKHRKRDPGSGVTSKKSNIYTAMQTLRTMYT